MTLRNKDTLVDRTVVAGTNKPFVHSEIKTPCYTGHLERFQISELEGSTVHIRAHTHTHTQWHIHNPTYYTLPGDLMAVMVTFTAIHSYMDGQTSPIESRALCGMRRKPNPSALSEFPSGLGKPLDIQYIYL